MSYAMQAAISVTQSGATAQCKTAAQTAAQLPAASQLALMVLNAEHVPRSIITSMTQCAVVCQAKFSIT